MPKHTWWGRPPGRLARRTRNSPAWCLRLLECIRTRISHGKNGANRIGQSQAPANYRHRPRERGPAHGTLHTHEPLVPIADAHQAEAGCRRRGGGLRPAPTPTPTGWATHGPLSAPRLEALHITGLHGKRAAARRPSPARAPTNDTKKHTCTLLSRRLSYRLPLAAAALTRPPQRPKPQAPHLQAPVAGMSVRSQQPGRRPAARRTRAGGGPARLPNRASAAKRAAAAAALPLPGSLSAGRLTGR